jgi:hypothetical protein
LTLAGLTALALAGAFLTLSAGAFLAVRLRHLLVLSFHEHSSLASQDVLSNLGQLSAFAFGLAAFGDFGDDFLETPLTGAFPHLAVLTFHLHTTHSSCVFNDGHTELSAPPLCRRRRWCCNLFDFETISNKFKVLINYHYILFRLKYV